jgi:preprotein translocase subunit SecE
VTKSKAERGVVQQENAIVRYFRETRGELRKVTWPSQEESQRLTVVVLGAIVVTAIFFWAFDSLFATLIEFIIQLIIGL